jgi:hypothetical protein
MHPTHVTISAVCLLCGAFALVGFIYPLPAMAITGIYFGYFFTIGAILVGLFIGASAVARAISNAAKPYLARHWLALVNAAVSVAFYAIVSIYMAANSTPHTDARSSSVPDQPSSARAGERAR